MSAEFQVPAVRRCAQQMAAQLGFSTSAGSQIATSVSELAQNLWRHTDCGGTICLSPIVEPSRVGLEVMSIDEADGIEHIQLAIKDHYSTCGGLGCGLGAVKRLMDDFTICSNLGKGTVVIAVKWHSCR